MSTGKLRWGILGTAHIARKNWMAIRNAGNATLTAVGSRDLKRSQEFIGQCQSQIPHPTPPKAFGSYEELIASPDVDALYIPLPTGVRKDWVVKAAAAGKHVVCEKPCGANLAEMTEMVETCNRHRVQFMDGVMFMHSHRLNRLREVLGDKVSVGDLRRIATGFSFCAPPEFFTGNIRSHSSLEPHGCLGDLGWYCIRFALWVMNWQLPERVTGRILAQVGSPGSTSSVPTEFSGELFFKGGVSSTFYCSFLTADQQWAHLSGTKGTLTLPDFVLPFFGSEASFETNTPSFRVDGCQFNMEAHIRRHSVEEHSNNHPSSQETNLFRNFSEQVLSGSLNSQWPEEALKTQRVMEDCLAAARKA